MGTSAGVTPWTRINFALQVFGGRLDGQRFVCLLLAGLLCELDIVIMAVTVAMRVVVAEPRVAHGHELHEEHDKDHYQSNTLDPAVLRDGSGEARVCQCFVCWREQVYEGCRDYHAGTKVLLTVSQDLENMAATIDLLSQ